MSRKLIKKNGGQRLISVRTSADLCSVAYDLQIKIPVEISISPRDINFSARFQPVNPNGVVIMDDDGSVSQFLKTSQGEGEGESLTVISTAEEFLAAIIEAKNSGTPMPETIVARVSPGKTLCYTDGDLNLRVLKTNKAHEGATVAIKVEKNMVMAKKSNKKKQRKASKAA